MMKVAPSLLAADFSALGEEVRKVRSADYLHIDIMDGNFVPNLSMGPAIVSGLRDKSELLFDVHLMVLHPLRYIKVFAEAGADMISFHIEALDDPGACAQMIRKLGRKAGAVLKPATKSEKIKDIINDIDYVLIMSVEPGFGGQKMMMEQLGKAKEIKSMRPDIIVEVDGGVTRDTAAACKNAGIDIVVAGTSVFTAENPEKEIDALRKAGIDN